MRGTLTGFALAAFLLTLTFPAGAQQTTKVYRIGMPSGTGSGYPTLPRIIAFREGLREFGYVEGKNLALEYRYSGENWERLPDVMAELVRLNVDVIFVGATTTAVAAKKATQRIPIVFAGPADPVGSGLVASLARPGGNATGLSLVPGLEMIGKHIELLREVLPKLTSVTMLADEASLPTAGFLTEAERAARPHGVQLQLQKVRDSDELDGALSAIKRSRPGALLVIASPLFNQRENRSRIVSFAANSRLPAVYPYSEFIDAGGLISYGANLSELFRRAAYFVDKILKGTKPADLPVEQPTKFELVVNLKAANQIGLTIPPQVLARADKVIK
jgi:putative ABC transport system substrate-binding protein